MLVFIVRRLAISIVVLLAATFIVYVLTCYSGDPYFDIREERQDNIRELKMQQRTEVLDLNVAPPLRYFIWLRGVVGCVVPGMDCNLGVNKLNQDVATLLGQAMASTMRLVLISALVAVVLGVIVGIISALRQYSGFDYVITFASFVFFSLPVFWVAVLLKQYGAIQFNDWLRNPVIKPLWLFVITLASAAFWQAVIAGDLKRRAVVAAAAAVGTLASLIYLNATLWFKDPALGIGLIVVSALGAALLSTALLAGFKHRNVLYATLIVAALGAVSYFATGPVLINPTWWHILALVLITGAVCAAVGYAMGGLDKGQAIRACLLTGYLTGSMIFLDQVLRATPGYTRKLSGRLISTIGSNTPNFSGNFWERFLDFQTHLILPSITLILISFAAYTRYTRASMLEVMNQDYVRTARSKGLTERTVIMRHAFRNALIPVTTLMAYDFAGIIGGAIITEAVFGWKGMGQLFNIGLKNVDPAPVMGFFLITGGSIVIFNMIADILYAYLDPRIRLD